MPLLPIRKHEDGGRGRPYSSDETDSCAQALDQAVTPYDSGDTDSNRVGCRVDDEKSESKAVVSG